MKAAFGWGLFFVCALVFAILVDTGKKHIGIPDYFWVSANLTLFMYLLQRYVGRPMAAFLDGRKDGVAEELQHAREQLVEADNLRAEVTRRLEEVESEVVGLKDRAVVEGAAEAERIEDQTRQEEERFLRRVDEEISRREVETRSQLARDTVDLTAQMARELLDREMTDDDRRRVLERSLDAMNLLPGKE